MHDAHEVLILLVKAALHKDPEDTGHRLNEIYTEYLESQKPISDVDVATQLQQSEPPKENA